MKKHIIYLIALLLVFGLAVSDCRLYTQTHTASYYQFSNVIIDKEVNQKHSKSYVFNQSISSEKTSLPIFICYLQFQDSYSLQVPVLIKTQMVLYQKVNSYTKQYTFLKEIVTSKNALFTLYIA